MGYFITGWLKKLLYASIVDCKTLIVGPALFGVAFFSLSGKRLRKQAK